MVIAMAIAAADRPTAMTTPNAASHLAPPPKTSTSMKGADKSRAIAVTDNAIEAIRTEKIWASFVGEDIIRSRSARA